MPPVILCHLYRLTGGLADSNKRKNITARSLIKLFRASGEKSLFNNTGNVRSVLGQVQVNVNSQKIR